MNQYEVPALLADELPVLQHELKQVSPLGNVNGCIRLLTEYTGKMAAMHRLDNVKQCMKLAEKLYVRGNNLVRNAIENVFVYSLTGLMYNCGRQEWQRIQAQMPVTLHSLYVQQVLQSGV